MAIMLTMTKLTVTVIDQEAHRSAQQQKGQVIKIKIKTNTNNNTTTTTIQKKTRMDMQRAYGQEKRGAEVGQRQNKQISGLRITQKRP